MRLVSSILKKSSMSPFFHVCKIFSSKIFSNFCYIPPINPVGYFFQLILRDPRNLLSCATILKYSMWFRISQLSHICVIDYPSNALRFSMVYIFKSIFYNYHLNLKLFLKPDQHISSLFTLFSGCI